MELKRLRQLAKKRDAAGDRLYALLMSLAMSVRNLLRAMPEGGTDGTD